MRLCWTLTALLALALTATLYVFGVRGSVAPGSDGRTAILLDPGERDLVLAEMRTFLQATQGILVAASKGDAPGAATAARAVGIAAQRGVPASLMGKLPLGFKQLGFDTHGRFDQLALDAESLGDPGQTLTALGDLLANCVACHAAFRIDAARP
jgi:hypothetical protein